MSTRSDRVVVMGASISIGFDMARRFLAEGSQLVPNARDSDQLDDARPATSRKKGERE